MTRDEYIKIRTNNPAMLIYEMYKAGHVPSKHGRLLSLQEVLTYLPMWCNPNDVLNRIFEKYDGAFNIMFLFDKNGKLIKVL